MTRSELIEAVERRLERMNAALEKTTDEIAVDLVDLFENWAPWTEYAAGKRLRYNDKLYRVVQTHTSQPDWLPDSVPALYTEIAKPGEIPQWKQPTGAHDAYSAGDKVRHNGDVWISTVNANIWEPGVYGWDKE